ncbi:MAG TPA: uroporphyrinogen-III synthase [Rhizomicrobium sp.]
MRVLVTRPIEDAPEIADRLKMRGHSALIAPLLQIRFHDGPEISLDGVQAILATSANGVRAIMRRTPRRDVALFAVGPQTAHEAERAGFLHVKNAQGDGDALARATRKWADPGKGALLHAAGAEAPKSLAVALAQTGFTVRREVLYEAVSETHLPDRAAAALRGGEIDAVLHFSPRSARVFRECALREKLAGNCANVMALCISPATASALNGLTFREIRVAETPDQAALLTLLP